jgi:hypothetical protein
MSVLKARLIKWNMKRVCALCFSPTLFGATMT